MRLNENSFKKNKDTPCIRRNKTATSTTKEGAVISENVKFENAGIMY